MQSLSTIRVLDLSRLLPGPFATMVLSDLGATVDKVEDPAQGDYLRHMPPQRAGGNVAFETLNRGKRSLVLDLKTPEGRDAFLRLLGHYDVLFEQFRPGVLSRLGLDPEILRERFPRLIVCSLSGYGQTGPLSHRPGHDLNYLARGGVLGAQGPSHGLPSIPGFQLADLSGGMWSVIAILAALRERDQTGVGRWLDISLTESAMPFAMMTLSADLAEAPTTRGEEALTGGIGPYGIYESADGGTMTLAALEPKFWLAFSAVTGLVPSMGDFLPGPHQVDLKARVAAQFKQKTTAEWESLALLHDLPIERVLRGQELTEDPHLRARRIFVNGPAGLQLRTPVTPVELRPGAAPHKGEHTDAILREAGFSEEEITTLACR